MISPVIRVTGCRKTYGSTVAVDDVSFDVDVALGRGVAAVVLQAIAFGALHAHGGFPRGAAGVGLTCVYGLMIGALRRRADGLLAPWIAHVLTDLVIVSIVIALAHH